MLNYFTKFSVFQKNGVTIFEIRISNDCQMKTAFFHKLLPQ